jgi:hypothetical protein
MAAKKQPTVHTVDLAVPDVGLSKPQVDKLKNKFKADLIETMGGKDALARLLIIVRVRVRIVIVSEA